MYLVRALRNRLCANSHPTIIVCKQAVGCTLAELSKENLRLVCTAAAILYPSLAFGDRRDWYQVRDYGTYDSLETAQIIAAAIRGEME